MRRQAFYRRVVRLDPANRSKQLAKYPAVLLLAGGRSATNSNSKRTRSLVSDELCTVKG